MKRNRITQVFIAVSLICGFASHSQAADLLVPPCWQDADWKSVPGYEEHDPTGILDGHYRISYDISNYSKDELVALLVDVGQWLVPFPYKYPEVYPNRIVIFVKPHSRMNGMERSAIKKMIETDVTKLSKRKGATSVQCVSDPRPSVSGGN
ncbi:MAG: hypothetical protein AABZ06_10080 [Bdellovibrionota bacterium]